MHVLIFDRCEHPDRAVASLTIVKDLDVFDPVDEVQYTVTAAVLGEGET